jgi:hypothetical protein
LITGKSPLGYQRAWAAGGSPTITEHSEGYDRGGACRSSSGKGLRY